MQFTNIIKNVFLMTLFLTITLSIISFGDNIEDRINSIRRNNQIEIGNAEDRIDSCKSVASRAKTLGAARKLFDDYIFVGDSRVVGQWMCSGRYHYIGEVAMGYSWLVNSAEPYLREMAAAYPDSAIVLCLGVNDFGNISSYIYEYQNLIDTYGKDRVYIESVNPINNGLASANGYFARNEDVIAFNNALATSFPENYIDTYTYLEQTGYGSSDGVHYDDGTYIKIEDYVDSVV